MDLREGRSLLGAFKTGLQAEKEKKSVEKTDCCGKRASTKSDDVSLKKPSKEERLGVSGAGKKLASSKLRKGKEALS